MKLGELLNDVESRASSRPAAKWRWYVLLDVTAFASTVDAESSVSSITVTGQSWVNLYADMDGLELSAQGPRVMRMHDDRSAFDGFTLTPAGTAPTEGEAIDIEQEMVSLADEQLHFEATAKLLEKAYAQLRLAIKER